MSRIDGPPPKEFRDEVKDWFRGQLDDRKKGKRRRRVGGIVSGLPDGLKRKGQVWFKQFSERKVTVGGLRSVERKKETTEEGSVEILYCLSQRYNIPLSELLDRIEPYVDVCLYLPAEAVTEQKKLLGKRKRAPYVTAIHKAADAIEKFWQYRPPDITVQTASDLREFARVISNASVKRGNKIAVAPALMGADLAQLIVGVFKNGIEPFPYAQVGRLIKITLRDRWSAVNPERALERLIGKQVKCFRRRRGLISHREVSRLQQIKNHLARLPEEVVRREFDELRAKMRSKTWLAKAQRKAPKKHVK